MPFLLDTKKPIDLVVDPKLPPSPTDPSLKFDATEAQEKLSSVVPHSTLPTGGVNPDSDVFQIRFTKEIFPSYEYVLQLFNI